MFDWKKAMRQAYLALFKERYGYGVSHEPVTRPRRGVTPSGNTLQQLMLAIWLEADFTQQMNSWDCPCGCLPPVLTLGPKMAKKFFADNGGFHVDGITEH